MQGRKSRYRTPDDVEAIIRSNLAQGIDHFFITDDNLARNKNREPIFDRLIEIRNAENLKFNFVIQVDTLVHRIPHFIDEKAAAAGAAGVPRAPRTSIRTALIGAKKKQNRIAEYRAMLLAKLEEGRLLHLCRLHPRLSRRHAREHREGHQDHPARIAARPAPRVLLLDAAAGLRGPQEAFLESGVAMDPDALNKYDLEHVVTGHPKMSKADWERAYRLAWETYYTPEHMITAMRRACAVATGISPGKMSVPAGLVHHGCVTIEKIHPLEGGYLRRKVRLDRRPGFPVVNPLLFYPRYAFELIAKHVAMGRIVWRMSAVRRALKRDPKARDYMDEALTPVTDADLDDLEMFNVTTSARAAADKAKRHLTPA